MARYEVILTLVTTSSLEIEQLIGEAFDDANESYGRDVVTLTKSIKRLD